MLHLGLFSSTITRFLIWYKCKFWVSIKVMSFCNVLFLLLTNRFHRKPSNPPPLNKYRNITAMDIPKGQRNIVSKLYTFLSPHAHPYTPFFAFLLLRMLTIPPWYSPPQLAHTGLDAYIWCISDIWTVAWWNRQRDVKTCRWVVGQQRLIEPTNSNTKQYNVSAWNMVNVMSNSHVATR